MKYEQLNELLQKETEKEKLRAESNEIKLENSRLQSYAIAIISLLLALFGLVLYRRYTSQKRYNLELEQKNTEIINKNALIEKVNEDKLKLQEENFKQKINERNKEFQYMTMELLEKNNAIENLKTNLQAECESSPEIQAVITSSLRQNLHIERLNDDFNKRFEMMNNDFQQNLTEKYPDLSNAELKVCSLLKTRISSKEIANLLNISTKTVENHRTNIRKKMNLDRSDDLIQTLNSIDQS